MARAVEVVRVVEMVRLVEVIRVVEVVYRHEENLGVKGPKNKNKNNKDVGLPMTMPQAAGKKSGPIISLFCILFKACLFNLTFYKGSHSKGLKLRALHVHQRKTKHFIAKLLAQPFMVLQAFLKSMLFLLSCVWCAKSNDVRILAFAKPCLYFVYVSHSLNNKNTVLTGFSNQLSSLGFRLLKLVS